MSGLCGMVRLDGAPASREQLAPVWSTLLQRGPDGGGCWAQGEVALGFRLLATTPESLSERLPLHHQPSGCTIVADARLDNREELAAALGIDPRGRGDGELILLGYLRWGDEVPLHLLGDYAFAIWDGRRHRLLAARDPMGMRQLHYAFRPGSLLAFATDDWALAAHPQVDDQLNEVRVVDLMQDLEAVDLTSTFFLGVERLPPAHLMVLAEGRLTVRRFWQLEPKSIRRSADPGEIAEELRVLLDQSVKARLRSSGRVGAMVSGGLDSSSVAALAARASADPLPTFSAVTRDAECIETAMIRRMQAVANLLSNDLVAEEAGEMAAEVQRIVSATNPFNGNTLMIGCLYRQAKQAACNVVLDGVTSDLLFSDSMVKIEWLRRGQWARVWREAKQEHDFYGYGPRPLGIFLRQARAAFLPSPLRSAHQWLRYGRDTLLASSKVLNREAFRRLCVAERRQAYREALPTPAHGFEAYRARLLVNNEIVIGREHYDRLASSFGVEARDPFNDLRLLDFALSLPLEALVDQGWSKPVLRAAMKGILPEEVRLRRSRHHVGFHFQDRALEAGARDWRPQVMRQRQQLERWLKPDIVDHVLIADPATLEQRARPSISLAQYLDQQQRRGQPHGKTRADPLIDAG